MTNKARKTEKSYLDAILINPCLFKEKRNVWKNIDAVFPSLGLASIASYVRENGFSVSIIDAPALNLTLDGFEKYLLAEYGHSNPVFVGFTSSTSAVKNAYAMSDIVKKVFPESVIVFGGVHATFMTEEVLANPSVDIVVRGEGELTFLEILSKNDLKDIEGISFRGKDGIINNSERERIVDLDALPFPAYDLLPMDKYFPAKGSYKRLPAISMITGRGCPGRCTFCSKTLGNKMVSKSAESLIEEIVMLQADYDIAQIMFYDDTFTVHRSVVKEFCGLIKEKRINISWCCFSRLDCVDPGLLREMKDAGCHQIMYGIESADQNILNSFNKKTDHKLAIDVVKFTKEAGIDVRAAFMIGAVKETRESVLKTLHFAIELDPDLAIFNITTPYPGTVMYKEADEAGMILSYNWDDYDLSKPVMKSRSLGPDEIQNLYHYCYRKFYFRWKYILKRLIRLFARPEEIKLVVKSIKTVLFLWFERG